MRIINNISFKDIVLYLKTNLRYDIISGFIVSLIALPLCLGVASASNFPPIMGVLTAIVGGLVVGLFSGSELAIKGPAAGLIVIVAGAVEEFGKGDLNQGYLMASSLIVLTGFIQVALGFLKVGKYADIIPSSVIHGMLAAIGIIIISKQVHLLIGISPSELKGVKPLDLIKMVPSSLLKLEWRITIVGVISLSILYLLPRVKNALVKSIPPFLFVIVIAIVLGQLLHLSSDRYRFFNALIDPGNLHIKFFFVPEIFNGENLYITIKYVFLLTIIGTIESVLTVKAVDLLDPQKRSSNYNQDIAVVGIGNVLSGFMGALPMISEVARSSANIANKAVTRMSAFMHGLFLMIFILIFSSIIKLIPVAALASILIYVGINLAHPKDFIKSLGVSLEHFLVFITTILVTLFEDLLIGVMAGMALKIFINYLRSKEFKRLFKTEYTTDEDELSVIIYLQNVGVFTNWLKFKKVLEAFQDKRIILDFSNIRLLDSAFIENIYRFKENFKGDLVFRGFMELKPLKKHINSMRIGADIEDTLRIHLSAHQLVLKKFCEENFYLIAFSSNIPRKYLNDFKAFKNTEIKLTHTYISGLIHEHRFEYFESLGYMPVDMIEYNLNALIIEFKLHSLPRFKLIVEDKLDDTVAKNQMSFPEFSVFHNRYSVYTREKNETHLFFNPNLIRFLEDFDFGTRVIETNGMNRVIIYNNESERNIQNLRDDLRLAEAFIEFTSIK
jgi:MFS superfamily sulfate permease-like transporter